MVALGFAVAWVGYLEIVYGWCLLKGWDITWKQLADPVHPYQWPAKGQQPPLISPSQILPGHAAPTTTAAATQPAQAGATPGSTTATA